MSLQVENLRPLKFRCFILILVVLSVGMGPAENSEKIAELFGIPIEDTGFIKQFMMPSDTVQRCMLPGIYVAGTANCTAGYTDSVASGWISQQCGHI